MSDLSTLRGRTFERLRRSIAGEPSDGFGLFHYYTYPFYKSVTGVDLNGYFHDPKVIFDTQYETIEKIDKCGSFQPDEGAVAEVSSLGGIVQFDKEGFISIKARELEDEEILAIRPGDPYGDNYMRRALEALQYMVDNAPKDIKVNPPVCHGPVTVCAQLMGMEDFFIRLMMDPEVIEPLLDVAVETNIRFMKAAEKILGAPLHHLLIADDFSAMMKEDMYREYVIPRYQAIFREFPHTQRWLHNDAKADHLCGAIADAGIQAWQHSLSIDLQTAMENAGGRVSLMGGIKPVTLQKLTAEETYDLCVETMKKFNGNTKFVLAAGGSINQVPLENVMAMFRAADEFKIGGAENI